MKENMFSYKIENVTNESELEKALAFNQSMFPDIVRHTFHKDFWLPRMKKDADLMLYAEYKKEVVGLVFGYVEKNQSITVAMVSSDARYRNRGIASSLLEELGKRVLAKGHHFIVLGAAETAEEFYIKCGYMPHLFIIGKPPLTLEQLRSLNDRHPEAWTYDDGKVIRLCLLMPRIDKELQHKYDATFPQCSTQTLFTKFL
jgi:GNAT superfamily N-acetyltransferase